jgi:capsular polysaccharide biosynthesis protein
MTRSFTAGPLLAEKPPVKQTRSLSSVLAALSNQRVVVGLVLVSAALLALAVVIFRPPKFSATTTVLMVAEPASQDPKVPSSSTKPLLSNDLPSLATETTVLLRVRDDLGDNVPIDTIRSRISARVTADSGIMPVSYTDTTPPRAIQGANAVGAEVTRFYREIATTRFDALIKDLGNQLVGRRVQLTRLDNELSASARLYPYIDAGATNSAEAGSVYQRLITLRAERAQDEGTIAADARLADATLSTVDNARPLAARDLADSDPAYKHIREQYATDFAELKRLSSFGTARYPGLIQLRETVAREAQEVDAARHRAYAGSLAANPAYAAALDTVAKSRGQLAADRARLQTVEQELATLHAQIGGGRIASDVARTRRDRDNAEAAYATIANRLASTIADRAEAASVGSVTVVDRALFAKPAAFTSGRVIAIAIMVLAVWLAITLAVMLDEAREPFRDDETVEAVYGIPVIGAVS